MWAFNLIAGSFLDRLEVVCSSFAHHSEHSSLPSYCLYLIRNDESSLVTPKHAVLSSGRFFLFVWLFTRLWLLKWVTNTIGNSRVYHCYHHHGNVKDALQTWFKKYLYILYIYFYVYIHNNYKNTLLRKINLICMWYVFFSHTKSSVNKLKLSLNYI